MDEMEEMEDEVEIEAEAEAEAEAEKEKENENENVTEGHATSKKHSSALQQNHPVSDQKSVAIKSSKKSSKGPVPPESIGDR